MGRGVDIRWVGGDIPSVEGQNFPKLIFPKKFKSFKKFQNLKIKKNI